MTVECGYSAENLAYYMASPWLKKLLSGYFQSTSRANRASDAGLWWLAERAFWSAVRRTPANYHSASAKYLLGFASRVLRFASW